MLVSSGCGSLDRTELFETSRFSNYGRGQCCHKNHKDAKAIADFTHNLSGRSITSRLLYKFMDDLADVSKFKPYCLGRSTAIQGTSQVGGQASDVHL